MDFFVDVRRAIFMRLTRGVNSTGVFNGILTPLVLGV